MGSIVLTTHIQATPERIFDFVCDIDRWTEWDTFAEEILEASDRPLVAGSTYVEKEGKNSSSWTVTEFDRPRRQVHVGQVPVIGTLTVEMDLLPGDGGTDFRHVVSYRVMPGPLRPLGWLLEKVYVNRYALTGMKKTAANAKRLIESG